MCLKTGSHKDKQMVYDAACFSRQTICVCSSGSPNT